MLTQQLVVKFPDFEKFKQDKQCTYYITPRCVHATSVAVVKQ